MQFIYGAFNRKIQYTLPYEQQLRHSVPQVKPEKQGCHAVSCLSCHDFRGTSKDSFCKLALTAKGLSLFLDSSHCNVPFEVGEWLGGVTS